MQNFLCRWYNHIVMPFIELISFSVEKEYWHLLQLFLGIFDLYIQSSLFLYPPQQYYSVYFTVHFVYQITSLQYLHGQHSPIWYLDIKQIYQKLHRIISRQNICEAQSQQQYFLLVGTAVTLVVPN